jgi:uncharacterized protein YjgD (DUF1641 family)
MDVVISEEVTYRDILKQMRDPELKRGFAFTLQFMKNLVNKNGHEQIKQVTLNNSKKED